MNENYFTGANTEGLEQKQITLFKCVDNVLAKHNTLPATTNSYGLVLEYGRPVGDLNKIKHRLDQELNAFIHNPNRITPHAIQISIHFKVTILKRPFINDKLFCIYIDRDNDGGGLLEDLYVSNINYCIAEKTSKISTYQNKYKEWWLLFIDFIGWDLYSWESYSMINRIQKSSAWNKIIIVNVNANKLLEM